MKILARITAGFFLGIGGVLILIGLGIVITGFIKVSSQGEGFGLQMLSRMINLAIGFAFTFQGMVLAALGEGLWLLTDLTTASQEMTQLLRRRATRQKQLIVARPTPPS